MPYPSQIEMQDAHRMEEKQKKDTTYGNYDNLGAINLIIACER
jgi:hypothetical protein